MPKLISMLRGINVSGHNKIRMADLKALYEGLHATDVTTHLQSGNVVFNCSQAAIPTIANSIQDAIEHLFGYKVSLCIRQVDEFQKILTSNPFLMDRDQDPKKLHVTFLDSVPSEDAVSKIIADPNKADEFQIYNREIYVFCPNGYGRTKLSNNFFEKKLGVIATTRNWKTVNALYELATSL